MRGPFDRAQGFGPVRPLP